MIVFKFSKVLGISRLWKTQVSYNTGLEKVLQVKVSLITVNQMTNPKVNS